MTCKALAGSCSSAVSTRAHVRTMQVSTCHNRGAARTKRVLSLAFGQLACVWTLVHFSEGIMVRCRISTVTVSLTRESGQPDKGTGSKYTAWHGMRKRKHEAPCVSKVCQKEEEQGNSVCLKAAAAHALRVHTYTPAVAHSPHVQCVRCCCFQT